MSSGSLALVALMPSLVALTLLALRDPKRLRSRRSTQTAASPLQRRCLALLLAIPGLGLAITAQWPAFLVWLGLVTAGGWLLVLVLSRAPPDPA